MHKPELIAQVAQQAHLHPHKADIVVAAIIEQVTNALSRNEAVTLPGFGSFNSVHRAARQGRHPKTGTLINIAASKQVLFRPGKVLKDAVNHKHHP